MYVLMDVCMYICMYVCMYVCTYVYMYVCMYMYMYLSMYTHICMSMYVLRLLTMILILQNSTVQLYEVQINTNMITEDSEITQEIIRYNIIHQEKVTRRKSSNKVRQLIVEYTKMKIG